MTPRHRGGPRPHGRARAAAHATLAALALAACLHPAPAQAAPWTDTVGVIGTTLGAATVPAPATFTCTGLGLGSVRFTWSAVAGATSYTVSYDGGAGSVTTTGTSVDLVGLLSGGTAWVRAHVAYPSVTWSSVPSTTRTYTFVVVSLCG